MKKILMLLIVFMLAMCVVGCTEKTDEKNCWSEQYKIDLCEIHNNAFRPVNIKRMTSKEEFEFVAENEEFMQTGFRAIVVKPKKGGIPQLAILSHRSYIDFSNKENYRIYLYQASYWRNASWVDSFLFAEVVMVK